MLSRLKTHMMIKPVFLGTISVLDILSHYLHTFGEFGSTCGLEDMNLRLLAT